MEIPNATPSPPAEARCPLCGRLLTFWNRRTLYKWRVCRKCRNAFANRRQVAWVIDYAAYACVIGGIHTLASFLGIFLPRPPYFLPFLAVPFLFKDGFDGMSLGKWLLGVQVVDAETYRGIGPGRSAIRNLPLFAPLLLLLWPSRISVGLAQGVSSLMLLIVASQLIRGRRWGDGWAHSKAIWRRYGNQPPFDLRGLACLQCGYDLTGNISGVCPECGTAIAGSRGLSEPRP